MKTTVACYQHERIVKDIAVSVRYLPSSAHQSAYVNEGGLIRLSVNSHDDKRLSAINFKMMQVYLDDKRFSEHFYEELAIYRAENLLRTDEVHAAIELLRAQRKWDTGLFSQNLVMLEGSS